MMYKNQITNKVKALLDRAITTGDYSILSAQQRCKFRKLGYDIPKLSSHPVGMKKPTWNRSREINPNWKGGGIKCVCKVCGKEFYVEKSQFYRSDVKKSAGKTCSIVCRSELKRLNRKVSILQEKLNRTMRRSMLSYLKRGVKNRTKWKDIVGYSVNDLMRHLESKFQKGMSWDNHGVHGWHIDHIVPVSSFEFKDITDPAFKECWSLNNLQPLWAKDNLRKGDKILCEL